MPYFYCIVGQLHAEAMNLPKMQNPATSSDACLSIVHSLMCHRSFFIFTVFLHNFLFVLSGSILRKAHNAHFSNLLFQGLGSYSGG